MDDVGQALRVKREALSLSARALSADLGKSPTYVSKVESGDIHLTFSGFAEIANRLGMTNIEMLYLLQLELRTQRAQVPDAGVA